VCSSLVFSMFQLDEGFNDVKWFSLSCVCVWGGGGANELTHVFFFMELFHILVSCG
jgi:hypothetical protein